MSKNTMGVTGRLLIIVALLAALAGAVGGCGKKQAQAPQAVPVKGMTVIQKNTPIIYEFVGEVEARDEVELRSKVSGMIVEKYIQGGTTVNMGQTLFVIDQRQYKASVLDYRSQVAGTEAALARVQRDVERYTQLYAQNAIAQQILDNTVAEEKQTAAQLDAIKARLEQAEVDVSETIILSPVNGRIDTNVLSTGSYVVAGQTVMATVSSINPVRVRFSISESDYLKFAEMARKRATGPLLSGFPEVDMILSDGSKYPNPGKIEQVDRGLAKETGTLTIKALVENPDGILVPGMFSRVQLAGEVRQNALLVPQRAVMEMLDKTFIFVVDKDSKSLMKPVKMGPRIGNELWLVESGLESGDTVIVEGFQKTPQGTPVKVETITMADLQVQPKVAATADKKPEDAKK